MNRGSARVSKPRGHNCHLGAPETHAVAMMQPKSRPVNSSRPGKRFTHLQTGEVGWCDGIRNSRESD